MQMLQRSLDLLLLVLHLTSHVRGAQGTPSIGTTFQGLRGRDRGIRLQTRVLPIPQGFVYKQPVSFHDTLG